MGIHLGQLTITRMAKPVPDLGKEHLPGAAYCYKGGLTCRWLHTTVGRINRGNLRGGRIIAKNLLFCSQCDQGGFLHWCYLSVFDPEVSP